jgi:hypothetical protein
LLTLLDNDLSPQIKIFFTRGSANCPGVTPLLSRQLISPHHQQQQQQQHHYRYSYHHRPTATFAPGSKTESRPLSHHPVERLGTTGTARPPLLVFVSTSIPESDRSAASATAHPKAKLQSSSTKSPVKATYLTDDDDDDDCAYPGAAAIFLGWGCVFFRCSYRR